MRRILESRPGGGGRGGGVSSIPGCMCPKVLFQCQGNEMNEKFSFKMGVRFAA